MSGLLKKPINESNWIVKQTAADVAIYARDIILQTAQQAIRKNGVFKIVLAGGTTPEQVYTLLAHEPCDWQHWHLYLGDERCLSVDDAERNSQMVQRILLDKVAIPEKNIHFIAAELGARKAASAYQKIVEQALPFDMVLLGMGEDGHTASLFPGQLHKQDELVHAVYDAPKPPSERVSLSIGALSANKYLLILVTGLSKKATIEQWRQGKTLPVARVSTSGSAVILLDSQAGSRKGQKY